MKYFIAKLISSKNQPVLQALTLSLYNRIFNGSLIDDDKFHQ